MAWARMPNYGLWFLRIAAYVILVFTAIPVLQDMPTVPERWFAGLLFAAVGALLGFFLVAHREPRSVRLYLVAQTGLILGIYAIDPAASLAVNQLFYILSAQAVLVLTAWEGGLWVLLYVLVTILGGVNVMGLAGLPDTLVAMGGNLFFGAFGVALRQAYLAERSNRVLLGDLQEANEQLMTFSEQVQQLAVSEERERIAREMHDALGHRLTVAVVQLEGAQRLIPSDPERAAAMIATMREELRQGLAELRRTVAALRTTFEEPLAVTLSRLTHAFEENTGLKVHLDLPAALPELPVARHHALYRAAQEALTNVQRHARAQQAWLSLALQEGELLLIVADDGRGFPEAMNSDRFGLRGIAERVTRLGGRLDLGVHPGGGARVEIRLPLGTEGEEAGVPGLQGVAHG